MSDAGEIRRIEHTLVRLSHELDEARREVAALRLAQAPPDTIVAGAASTPPVAAPPALPETPRQLRQLSQLRQPPEPRWSRPATAAPSNVVEQFVGRYGALALAVITIVMGAGALVSWALREGLLTPVVRVLLGSLLAAALAGAGTFLRSRGSRKFGHTLLALSLAVVHVVAWGAGPQLGLVPASVSLAIAVAASLALSILALRDENEELFAVGVVGALLAPFVQQSGAEQYVVLAMYGFAVCAVAMRTIAARPWQLVAGIVVIAGFSYAIVLGGYHGETAWLSRDLAPGFALALAVTALGLTRPPMRPWIVLSLVAALLLAGGMPSPPVDSPLEALSGAPDLFAMAIAGAAIALYAARESPPARSASWIGGALLLPLLFLLRTMFSLVPSGGGRLGGAVHAAVAGIWVLGYAAAALGQGEERRGTLLAASGIVATWVAVLAAHAWPDAVPAACAVVAIATAWVWRREKLPDLAVATLVAGGVGFVHGMLRLVDLPGFGVPFATGPTAAIAAGVAGLLVAARLLPEVAGAEPETGTSTRTIANVLLASACFLWWRAELSRAFSADASTFLLILYFATFGVVVLWRGRVTGSRRLRQAGLALSVWAAISAIGGAFAVQQIGLRVGSYLAVGVFLLGVAWWYRALPEGREGGA